MVLRVRAESGDSSPPPLATSVSSSPSISSHDDVEGGSSSQDENEIVEKSIPVREGIATRRRSQCEQLSFRQRSEPPQPTGFRRWSTMMSLSSYGYGDLSKSIQLCPPSVNSEEQSGSSFPSHSRKYHPLILIALIGLGALAMVQRAQITSLHNELIITKQQRDYMDQTRSNLLKQLATREQSLEQYRHTHEKMMQLNNDMSASIKNLKFDYKRSVEELDRLRGVEKRVSWSEGRWNKHVDGIRKISKMSAVDKFGKGPHRVELKVQFPSSSELETINIEMAPLEMMPHSVHTFLEQVDQGAWKGVAFGVHAGHVLMAGPSDGTPASKAPTVLFPEFNLQYPHDKYTVAFPSQPSSTPDFYINLQPNTIHHSPRIEGDEYVEGEPCFGRIVDQGSRRVVDRMDRLSARQGGRLEKGVTIVSARILGR
eukprot:CAMPEP_0172528128 /NCGR_PEP_ID=MMETSP1067-20121228/2614_1 /TAXON_ID=265564 ORGANISM="Thalassiosira punctigera, Strain Tpunct2005C2" /NCGR_SAMPLE_ID=MMETSP1067 /ASSEMBLY_ACC=CAM_ASM_000444 /LENGTH=426 /DNA_ID=CAMNT_0013311991 /DNA_START=47 /DNA_END=1327 /DNA_ORIENTATION=-